MDAETQAMKAMEISQTNYLSAELHKAEARVAELEAALAKAKEHIETHWHGHGENGYFLRHAHETICDALKGDGAK